jgi:hypothetical protein
MSLLGFFWLVPFDRIDRTDHAVNRVNTVSKVTNKVNQGPIPQASGRGNSASELSFQKVQQLVGRLGYDGSLW